jgi:hypothetical protein
MVQYSRYSCIERLKSSDTLTEVAVLGCEEVLGRACLSEQREVCCEAVVGFKGVEERLPEMMVHVNKARVTIFLEMFKSSVPEGIVIVLDDPLRT